MPDELLTTAEVCDRFRVSKTAIFQWVSEGRLRAYRLGPKVWRFRADEVARFLAEAEIGKEGRAS